MTEPAPKPPKRKVPVWVWGLLFVLVGAAAIGAVLFQQVQRLLAMTDDGANLPVERKPRADAGP
jgi:hypothetical protein